jgi:tRNA threonylcarbamoyl adenosine modification protein (Sua5/YciO/YrdC/YwlC family)
MQTEYLTLDSTADDLGKIAHAANVLQAGGLVAFPTETVYGLGADARHPEALVRLSKITGRRENKPYPLLVPSLKSAEEAVGGFNRIARKLARIYWPGALTITQVRHSKVKSDIQSFEKENVTLAMRLSDHRVVRSLLSYCGFPLAAPSANRMGAMEPISGQQVRETLQGQIALILDGGSVWQGRPSTVVKCGEDHVEIQRDGSIPSPEIMEMARPTVLFVCTGNTCRSPMAQGMMQALLQQVHRDRILPIKVLSAGISARDGASADRLAIEAMREVGVDISRHHSLGLNFQLLDSADYIFTMTREHEECILSIDAACQDRLQMLTRNEEDIPDPIFTSIEQYRQIRDKIARSLKEIVRVME